MEALPIEITEIILSYLDKKRHIRQVCRQWFDIINYSRFSIGLILNSEIDEFIKCFSRYNRPIGLTLNKDEDNSFLVRSSVTKLAALTQLTYLDITCKDAGIAFGRLTNLRTLKTKSVSQSDLQQLTNLTELEVWNKIVITDSTRQALPTSLVSLRFAGYDTYSYRSRLVVTELSALFQPLTRVTKLLVYRGGEDILNCTPNLQRLTLRGHAKFPPGLFLSSLYYLEAHSTSVPQHQQVTLTKLVTFDAFQDGIWNVDCLTNLKELNMEYGWTSNINSLTNMQSLNLRFASSEKIMKSLQIPDKLTSLILHSTMDAFPPEISTCTNLIDLKLLNLWHATPSFVSSFHQLTRLWISGAIQHTYLSALTRLKDLTVDGNKRADFPPYELDLRALMRLTSLNLTVSNHNFIHEYQN